MFFYVIASDELQLYGLSFLVEAMQYLCNFSSTQFMDVLFGDNYYTFYF